MDRQHDFDSLVSGGLRFYTMKVRLSLGDIGEFTDVLAVFQQVCTRKTSPRHEC